MRLLCTLSLIGVFCFGCVFATNSTVPPTATDVPVTWKTYFFGCIVGVVFVCLMLSIAPVFSVLCSAAVFMYLVGIVNEAELFSGLVNNGVLSIAMLYVVVHPVVDLPLMKLLIQKVLGSSHAAVSEDITDTRPAILRSGANALSPEMISLGRWARFKVCLLSILSSSFLENTPQTAMFTPLVTEHCRKIGLAPSQILMPMTFAILLGNYFPLGYSSNLIVSGLMEKQGLGELPLFELAKVNLPLLLPVLAYLVFAPRYLLPLRRGGMTFYTRFKVTHSSPLVGQEVSRVFEDFFSSRTESSEKVAVYRQSKSEYTVGKKLAWEKIREPFCRLMTIQAGDDIVVGGLIATIGQSTLPGHTVAPRSSEEMLTQEYVSPVLQQDSAPLAEPNAGHTTQELSVQEEEAARRAALTSSGHALPTAPQSASVQVGEIERRLNDIILSALDATQNPEETTKSPSTLSTRSFAPTDKRSHQNRIRTLCLEYGVMMLSLKVSVDGCNLLKDDVAFAKCPNLVATSRLLLLPSDEGDLSPEAPSSPRARADSHVEQLLLNRRRESDMTWAEWHFFKGGRQFRASVPSWLSIGNPETVEEDHAAQGPQSPTTDISDPHKVAPPHVFGDEKKSEAKWHVVVMPWWYEYMSLVIFLGIVVASFFDVKLSISCFVACSACVLMRLVSTKELVKALPVEIYLLVAFSFPLGSGMHDSGLASALGNAMVDANVTGIRLLYLVGFVTLIFTNMITAQGSVQVIFPLVVKVYEIQGRDPLPGILMMLSMLACALCTPFAIPSNAVIIVPGGYQPMDYFKFGAPLSAMVLLLAGMFTAAIYDSW